MLEVASEKLTERERECLTHFWQAHERGASFAEYCRTAIVGELWPLLTPATATANSSE
jgi:hypothetical protein